MSISNSTKLADQLVHLGRETVGTGRLVNPPIEVGSTMLFDTLEEFEAARDSRYETGTHYYGRYGTGASYHLETMFAQIEGGFGCTLTSSGVAAITMSLMGVIDTGDHLLVADHVYGNTRGFCDLVLKKLGVEVEYYDPMIGAEIKGLFRPNTAAIMFEAPGSGTFEFPDIRGIAAAAKASGITTILDGTWATPVFCQPIALGVDVVVHSGSKYVSGHSDSMIGFIVCATEELHKRIRKTVMAYGDKPGAHEIQLSLRGLRTLELRMKQVDAAGREVAGWLCDQPQVKHVLHPAFKDCPGSAFWRRDFGGAAGLFGVIFKTADDVKVRTFVDSLQMFGIGVSWGGYESLVLPVVPGRTARPWTEKGRLVRFNIGFESPESLIDDLTRTLPLLNE